jgi:hypothetical protein
MVEKSEAKYGYFHNGDRILFAFKVYQYGQKAEKVLDQMRELHSTENDEVEVSLCLTICYIENYHELISLLSNQPDNVRYARLIKCKQVSTSGQVRDLTRSDKLQLMQDHKIEVWPFGNHESSSYFNGKVLLP